MKKSILLFSLFVSSFISGVSAENILTLTNPKTQETEVFRKGSFIVFELKKDNSIREGFIAEIGDSSLTFTDESYESQVSLSEINILAGSSKAKVTAGKIAGAVGDAMVVAGMTVFDCGLDFFSYGDYYYWPLGGSIWLAGAFIAGIGYAFDWAAHPLSHAVRVRNYRDWNARIINESDQPVVQEKVVPPVDSVKTEIIPYPDVLKKEKSKKSKSGDDVYGE